MVDERELLDLAKADGIPERLAERIIDQLVSQGRNLSGWSSLPSWRQWPRRTIDLWHCVS
jgi:hypothetical protein